MKKYTFWGRIAAFAIGGIMIFSGFAMAAGQLSMPIPYGQSDMLTQYLAHTEDTGIKVS